MNFFVSGLRDLHSKSSFDNTDSYKVSKINNTGLVVNNRHDFHLRFPLIFSEAVMRDNLKLLSKEQYGIIQRYFTQADTGLVDDDLKQLDKFLGEWRDGE
jgi:hypothetical protein